MVQFTNWWDIGNNTQDVWFQTFFRLCCSTFEDANDDNIEMLSVFGPIHNLTQRKKDNNKIRLFFTGENTKCMHTQYGDEQFVSQHVDIVLSFFHTTAKSIRFPLWCMYWNFFQEGLFTCKTTEKNGKAIIVANHTANGLRSQIVSMMQQMGVVVDCNRKDAFPTANQVTVGEGCAGKIETIRQYTYNICCENSYAEGYVTEKCFEALYAGCIPIYLGNRPLEPNVLCQENIVYVNDQEAMLHCKEKRFDEKRVWTDDAILHIFGTYLKVWSKIVSSLQWKKRSVTIPEVSYEVRTKGECVSMLCKHWKRYNHFCYPRAVFKNGEESIYMEDIANEVYAIYHV